MSQQQESVEHICFSNDYEYFWIIDPSGNKYVARSAIYNIIDPLTKQRTGARFEGTEGWFRLFGSTILAADNKTQANR